MMTGRTSCKANLLRIGIYDFFIESLGTVKYEFGVIHHKIPIK